MIRTVEVTINVRPDGQMSIDPSPPLAPGIHHGILVVESESARTTPGTGLNALHQLDWPGWPAESTFRREDIYGDDEP
jgi:hypothetical protein